MKLYKFLNGNESEHGNQKWILNKWYKIEGELEMCSNGFHCSELIQDALYWVAGNVLCEVEVRGESITDDKKQVWSEMRIVKRYKWTKKQSLMLAIMAWDECKENWEKKHPNDKRPHEAIEATKKVLEHDTQANRSAAELAAWSAAWSAESAAWSAHPAARSAELAAHSAESAAWSAHSAARSAAHSAESAWSAAWSAARSARSAAESAARKRIHDRIIKETIPTMKEVVRGLK